jgi:hypothetical protein
MTPACGGSVSATCPSVTVTSPLRNWQLDSEGRAVLRLLARGLHISQIAEFRYLRHAWKWIQDGGLVLAAARDAGSVFGKLTAALDLPLDVVKVDAAGYLRHIGLEQVHLDELMARMLDDAS